MPSKESQSRTTPVDGYDVVEQPPGIFMVISDEGPVEQIFESFSAAYRFIQKTTRDTKGSGTDSIQ